MRAILSLMLLTATATPVAAQSMNVPLIVETVMGEVCVPFARDGDLARAVRAAQAGGYAVIEGGNGKAADAAAPAGWVELFRRHAGTVTLGREGGRGLCAVGIHEGTPAMMGEAAAPYLGALGLAPAEADGVEGGAAAWRGEGVRLEIAPSARFRPGSELRLSFPVPAGQ
jgi:hypothetical protein